MNFTNVDAYFETITGTENQVRYALSILSEYRAALFYALEEGKSPTTNSAYIIDRRDNFAEYLKNLSCNKTANKTLIKLHEKSN